MPLMSLIERSGYPLRNTNKAREVAFTQDRYELVAAFATLPADAFASIVEILEPAAAGAFVFAGDDAAGLEQLGAAIAAYRAAGRKP